VNYEQARKRMKRLTGKLPLGTVKPVKVELCARDMDCILKGYQAINDCLEIGLNGEGGY